MYGVSLKINITARKITYIYIIGDTIIKRIKENK